MTSRAKSLTFLILPIILATSLSYYLQGAILTHRDEFELWLSGFGPYVILVYILLQILTVVIAPLGGFFLVVAMIALFGPGQALILAYFVTTPCYLINFYLAKRYGRPLVQGIIGKDSLEKIDHLVQDAGISTIIILKLFQGGSFDYLAYGLGLTRIKFKTFALINFIAGVPSIIISYYVISTFSSLTMGIIVYYIVTIVLAGVSIYLNYIIRKLKKNA